MDQKTLNLKENVNVFKTFLNVMVSNKYRHKTFTDVILYLYKTIIYYSLFT